MSNYDYVSGNAGYGEYTAQVLRGWPADGARERAELVKQGSLLVNSDVVEMQPDGTVDKVSGTASKRVGLVVRGNADSSSAANANGTFMTPQPAKTASIGAWSGGYMAVTVTGHGYVKGNIVVIAGVTTTAVNGTYTITSVTDANTFVIYLASTPGSITQGSPTSTLSSTANNSGKAVVLWGNYIVATSNYNTGATYVPGSPVFGKSGKYDLANGTTDPECGHVLRVQGAVGNSPTYLVIVAY